MGGPLCTVTRATVEWTASHPSGSQYNAANTITFLFPESSVNYAVMRGGNLTKSVRVVSSDTDSKTWSYSWVIGSLLMLARSRKTRYQLSHPLLHPPDLPL